MTSVSSSPLPKSLIIQRLRLEAVLKHQEWNPGVENGRLQVAADFGLIEVEIRGLDSLIYEVVLSVHLGTCPTPEPELTGFLAALKSADPTMTAEMDPQGRIRMGWASRFVSEIDCAAVLNAMTALGNSAQALSTELRERFFISPGEPPLWQPWPLE